MDGVRKAARARGFGNSAALEDAEQKLSLRTYGLGTTGVSISSGQVISPQGNTSVLGVSVL